MTGNHPEPLACKIDLQLEICQSEKYPHNVFALFVSSSVLPCLINAGLMLERIKLLDGLMCSTCDFSEGVVSTAAKLVSCWKMKRKKL